MSEIITTADVAPWVQSTAAELDADPLAAKAIVAISNLVNETVFEQETDLYWDLDLRKAPQTAKDVAEQVFARIYPNPDGLASETTGPMTERRAEFMLTGLELRPGEVERLRALRSDAGGNGLWLLSVGVDDGPVDESTYPYVDAYNGSSGAIFHGTDYLHA